MMKYWISLKRYCHPLLFCALSGCSYLPDKPEGIDITKQPECLAAMLALDHLAASQSGTLQGNRISGMPWLRSNRLSEAKLDSKSKPDDLHALLTNQSNIARSSLLLELSNVDKQSIERWRKRYKVTQTTPEFIRDCAAQAVRKQLETPTTTRRLLKQLPSDNDYSTIARVAGLYPLAAIPFRRGVIKEQATLKRQWGAIQGQRWYAYHPDRVTSTPQSLLSRYAPTWLINSTSAANLPGTPYWQANRLMVDTERATTFAFISEGIWQHKPLTQLNYVLWFNQRPRLKRFDWVAGKHDALVFRVNLNRQGEVVAYDSIHLCGCWYRLFLPKAATFRPIQRYWQEPVLAERVDMAERMAIYISKDTHQIQYLEPAAAYDDTTGYVLAPFNDLLTLPTANGSRAIFNRRGYVAGSERPERWLFWPMGVKNPGALRRFGDHAISFVGRRYFDEPRLLERLGLSE